MKLSEKILTFGAALIISAALLAGCATPVVTPGSPAQPAVTNSVTGAITPPVAATPAVTNGYVPNSTVTSLVAEGNAAAPLVPAPYGTALTALLALVSLGAGYVAQAKSKQLNTANAVTTAIVQGVEAAGNAEPSIAAAVKAVKQSVATVSKANGVSDAVESAVNKVTGAQ